MSKGIKNKLAFVGLSGGVDSSVSAAILKEQGYEVVGVFIKTWHPDFLPCTWREERRDAMRAAAVLDIPFLTFDLEDVYKKEVADYMIREYKAGRTPNPDVMCNKEVKFGAFFKKALEMGADYVATGHYASIQKGNLLKGKDSSKDQSYFLWTLKKEQISRILFPIGHFKKNEVRNLARKLGLHTADKKDSQGVCFLGALDMKDFLKNYVKEKKGDVLNQNGEIIGEHDGAIFYTLGERHGFEIYKKSPEDKPYYIIGKEVGKNLLYASDKPSENQRSEFVRKNFMFRNANWINGLPEKGKKYEAQIRYHGEFLSCKIKTSEVKKAEVIFSKNIMVAPGQSVVFYDKEVCLGGGVVE